MSFNRPRPGKAGRGRREEQAMNERVTPASGDARPARRRGRGRPCAAPAGGRRPASGQEAGRLAAQMQRPVTLDEAVSHRLRSARGAAHAKPAGEQPPAVSAPGPAATTPARVTTPASVSSLPARPPPSRHGRPSTDHTARRSGRRGGPLEARGSPQAGAARLSPGPAHACRSTARAAFRAATSTGSHTGEKGGA